MMHARLIPDAHATMTPGDAVAGMILHGLGCAPRPVSWPPQVVARSPLDLWCREGVEAAMCPRFTRGRTREAAYAYGGDLRLQELARAVCAHDGLALRCKPLDPTRWARRGEDLPAGDEPARTMPPGDSQEPRPDVAQAGRDRLGSHEGGGPCVRHRGAGHPADLQVCQDRAGGVMRAVPKAPSPRAVSADAPLAPEAKAPHRQALGFMTRIPHTIGVVSPVSMQALPGARWHGRDATTREQGVEWCHDGRAQRWVVGCSPAARERAEATVTTARQWAYEAIATPGSHLQAQRFATPAAAPQALAAWAKAWPDHPLEARRRIAPTRDARHGRPTPHTPLHASAWPMARHGRPHAAAMRPRMPVNAGVVRGPHSSASAGSDPEVMAADQGQAPVDGGVRVRPDPRVLVASWCVTTPCRSAGLLMVMTLAWLVDSVTQRRRRQQLARQPATVPNPLQQPTERPTWRGGFPRLDGMHRVRVTVQGERHDRLEGLHEVTRQRLRWFGERVWRLYHMAPGEGGSMSVLCASFLINWL
jgi:hypothetical protein